MLLQQKEDGPEDLQSRLVRQPHELDGCAGLSRAQHTENLVIGRVPAGGRDIGALPAAEANIAQVTHLGLWIHVNVMTTHLVYL